MRQYECERCPLRGVEIFRKFTKEELGFVSDFKSGELAAEAGTTFLTQGSSSAYVYTVLSGWGYRYKDLEDGRRQVLNFVFPGELVGLQGAVLKEMEHSVDQRQGEADGQTDDESNDLIAGYGGSEQTDGRESGS